VLDLGSEMARNQGQIPDHIYAQVAQRFNEQEMVLLIAFAGQMIATNVFSNAIQTEIDPYLIPYTASSTRKAGHQ
jgi:alkylhydroperoxidase family enzyme